MAGTVMLQYNDVFMWTLIVLLTAGKLTSRPPHTGWPSRRRRLFQACSDPWWTETETWCRSGAPETV